MKKRLIIVLALMMIISLVPMTITAETTTYVSEAGVYGIQAGTDVTIKVLNNQDAEISGTAVNGTTTKLANVEGAQTIFKSAEKLKVTLANSQSDKQYLVLLVTGSSLPTAASEILYIDQKAGNGGNLEFIVYPTFPTSNTDMSLWITSNDSSFNAADHKSTLSYYVPYTLGDVDGNGVVNALDVSALLQGIAGLKQLTPVQRLAGDVVKGDSNNVVINAIDASQILRKLAGLINSF